MTRPGASHHLFILLAIACALLWAAPAAAFPSRASENHPESSDDWQSYLRQGNTEKAEPLCQALLEKSDPKDRIEGYKCMANVILFKSKTPMASPDQGAQAMHQGWTTEGADKAIEQLEQAIKLAPGDLSLHQMRLFVLSRSGQMDKLPQALQNSLAVYEGPEAIDHWLSFAREFWNAQEYAQGMQYMDVLAAKYPDNPKVLGNLAAFAAQGGKLDMAMDYANKAVELQPENPSFIWNLGSLHERKGDNAKADELFNKALKLFKDPETLDAAWCTYSQFVKNNLKDEQRAQEIMEKHCRAAQPPQ